MSIYEVVWIAERNDSDGGSSIIGVFSDEAEAERWCTLQDYLPGIFYSVIGWKVNQPNAQVERTQKASKGETV